MKVWVITESCGYDVGDVIRRLCSTPQKAADWIAGQCGCDKRHDLFAAEPPPSLKLYTGDINTYAAKWREWRKPFCVSNPYDVEDYEVDDA